MLRLTKELIRKAPQIVNPLGERELDLRRNAIHQLDEDVLAQLQDDFDAIDLSDNLLKVLDGFPHMMRLTTLVAHRNKDLVRIRESLPSRLPQLHTLILNGCGIASYAALAPLAGFKHLLRISLIDNPIMQKQHHQQQLNSSCGGASLPPPLDTLDRQQVCRLYLIYLCPTLKLIDFNRVLDVERQQVKKLRSQLVQLSLQALMNKVAGTDAEGGSTNTSASVSSSVPQQQYDAEGRKIRKRGRNATAAASTSDATSNSNNNNNNASTTDTTTNSSTTTTKTTPTAELTEAQLDAMESALENRLNDPNLTQEQLTEIEDQLNEVLNAKELAKRARKRSRKE